MSQLLLQGRMQHERDEGHQQKLMLATMWAQISDFHKQDEVCSGPGLVDFCAFGRHTRQAETDASLCFSSVAATNPYWCMLDDGPLVLQALNAAIKAAYAANSLTLRGWRDQGAAVDTHLHQHLQPAASSLQQQCAAGADSFASELAAFWLQPPLQLQQAGQPQVPAACGPAAMYRWGPGDTQQPGRQWRAPAQGHHGCWQNPLPAAYLLGSKDHTAHCLSSGTGQAW